MTTSKSANLYAGKMMSATLSVADFARPVVTEFGVVNGAPQSSTSGAHRARLLAPMSARQDTAVRRDTGPRRTGLSTATAMTASALAKRASRELRPPTSRRSSRDTASGQDETDSIKASKSLHSKLNLRTKLPSSSSSSSIRKSPQSSPADDDELSADAEMQAYVRKRQARRTAGKKDDLADVVAFPEDIAPATPMSQRGMSPFGRADSSIRHEAFTLVDRLRTERSSRL
jgi:dual specificity tyrosine-phosphorylation-regulated kinase 2/3/4